MPYIVLSILLPIHNYNIRNLVAQLTVQMQGLEVEIELLCFDDGSAPIFSKMNQSLAQIPCVHYHRFTENQGRAAIRNSLADSAQFDYLLFLDSDCMPESRDFLANYLSACTPDTILYGGLSYAPLPPAQASELLRWKYGHAKEQVSVEQRQKAPYQSFKTSNFLAPKSIFQAIRFDEQLRQYGHEDTLFGWELKQRSIPIQHLDNPVRHLGLEPAEQFLEKTEQAIKNLLQLEQEYPIAQDIRLSRMARKLQAAKLAGLYRWWFAKKRSAWRKNLISTQPSLRYFALYKLGYYLQEKKNLS